MTDQQVTDNETKKTHPALLEGVDEMILTLTAEPGPAHLQACRQTTYHKANGLETVRVCKET